MLCHSWLAPSRWRHDFLPASRLLQAGDFIMRRSPFLPAVASACGFTAANAQQPMQRVQSAFSNARGGPSAGFIVGSVTNLNCMLRPQRPPGRTVRRANPQASASIVGYTDVGDCVGGVRAGAAARAGRPRRQLWRRGCKRIGRRRCGVKSVDRRPGGSLSLHPAGGARTARRQSRLRLRRHGNPSRPAY